MSKILSGIFTEVPALVGYKAIRIVRKTSKLGLGIRLVSTLPAALTATVLFTGVVPIAILVGRIVHPILVAAKSESKKQKIAAIALMLPKLLVTLPVVALGATVAAVASPFLFSYLTVRIGTGQAVYFMKKKERLTALRQAQTQAQV